MSLMDLRLHRSSRFFVLHLVSTILIALAPASQAGEVSAESCPSNRIVRSDGWTTIAFPKSIVTPDHWAVDPANPDRILVWHNGRTDHPAPLDSLPPFAEPGEPARMWVTVDGGCTWRDAVFPPGAAFVQEAVIYSPDLKAPPYVAVVRNHGLVSPEYPSSDVVMSTDAGQTWSVPTEISSQRPTVSTELTIEVAPTDPRRLYITHFVGFRDFEVMASDDAGKSWTLRYASPQPPSCPLDEGSSFAGQGIGPHQDCVYENPKVGLSVAFNDPSLLHIGYEARPKDYRYISQDGGRTWIPLEGPTQGFAVGTSEGGSVALLGTDWDGAGGCRATDGKEVPCIWYSGDSGNSWTKWALPYSRAVGGHTGEYIGLHFGVTTRSAVVWRDFFGDEGYRLLRVDLRTGRIRDLTPSYLDGLSLSRTTLVREGRVATILGRNGEFGIETWTGKV